MCGWVPGPRRSDKGITAQGEFGAVTLAVTKKPGENAVDVADKLLKRVEELKGSVIPDDVKVTTTRNYGVTANDKAMKLIKKLFFATFAVVALVWFALGRREAVIVGIAVLLTLAVTLFASWAYGFTLNRVSLFALIFSIGILVDDAIVVVENIHRRRELAQHQPLSEIIPEAVDEVGSPTILATFTVIAALLPMAFVSGLMGPYMSPIPINASMGMLISLAIAFIITPWLAHKLADAHHAVVKDERDSKIARFFRERLSPFLNGEHGKPARRKLWIGILAALLLAVSLALVKLVVLKMLPFDNKSEFQVVVDMPTGTALEQTAGVMHEIGAYLATVPEVTDYEAYAGTASPINFNGLVRQYYLRSEAEQGDIQVNLLDIHHRSRSSHQIATSVREPIEKIAKVWGAKVKIVEVPPGPPVMSPIVAEIYGPDYQGARKVASKVHEQFLATPDIVGVDDTVGEAAPKLILRVMQSKAALLGVAQRDIVDAVQIALSGQDVTALHDPDAKYAPPIRLSLPAEQRSRIDDVLKLKVRARDGALVPLSEVVQVVQVQRDYPIYHKDLMPVVFVTGDMAGKLDSPLYGMFAINSKTSGMDSGQGGHAEVLVLQATVRSLCRLLAQVGRRMAGHFRDLPRHGHRLCGRAGADLPAGGGAIQELCRAAGDHGADPADHHRRDAGACPVRCAVHRHLDDRHDRAGGHHRAQFHPAGGFRQPAAARWHRPAARGHQCGGGPRQADHPDRAGSHAGRAVHPG